jgi:hypothetical protein
MSVFNSFSQEEILKAYFRLGGTPESLFLGLEQISSEIGNLFNELEYQRSYEEIWYSTMCKHSAPPMKFRVILPKDFKFKLD